MYRFPTELLYVVIYHHSSLVLSLGFILHILSIRLLSFLFILFPVLDGLRLPTTACVKVVCAGQLIILVKCLFKTASLHAFFFKSFLVMSIQHIV